MDFIDAAAPSKPDQTKMPRKNARSKTPVKNKTLSIIDAVVDMTDDPTKSKIQIIKDARNKKKPTGVMLLVDMLHTPDELNDNINSKLSWWDRGRIQTEKKEHKLKMDGYAKYLFGLPTKEAVLIATVYEYETQIAQIAAERQVQVCSSLSVFFSLVFMFAMMSL